MPLYKNITNKEVVVTLGKIEIKIPIEPTFLIQKNLHVLFPDHIQKIDNPEFKYWTQGLINPKFFITGLTATGKTFLSKKIAKEFNIEYYSYDEHWDYKINTDNDKKYVVEFLNKLPNSFVIDAVPLSPEYFDFQNYRNENIVVICVFKSDITKWIKNIINKPYYTTKNMPNFKNEYYKDWLRFYNDIINTIKPDFFYDSTTNKTISCQEFKELKNDLNRQITQLKEKKQYLLKDYLDTLTYDKYYQDIECIDFMGYSESYKTWENIKDLVRWENKSIIDLGCFHGYFSFKAKQAGTTNVTGLEISEIVLETTNIIRKIIGSNANFLQWSGKDKTPNADIALVLNMLHHTKNEEETLKNINAETAIFEINSCQIPLIEKYFTIIKNISSHRENRRILLGEKK